MSNYTRCHAVAPAVSPNRRQAEPENNHEDTHSDVPRDPAINGQSDSDGCLPRSRAVCPRGKLVLPRHQRRQRDDELVRSRQLSGDSVWGGGYSANPPVNNAANFNYSTSANAPGITTVYADGPGGFGGAAPGPNAWSLVFGQTNGYQTVVIPNGVTLFQEDSGGGAGSGLYVSAQAAGNGGDGTTVSTPSRQTRRTTRRSRDWAGRSGGGNSVHIGQGADHVDNHYAILDMSGLGTFVETNFQRQRQPV